MIVAECEQVHLCFDNSYCVCNVSVAVAQLTVLILSDVGEHAQT